MAACERCPFAGNCASCPMRTPTKEVSSDIKSSSFRGLMKLIPDTPATIFFNASGEFLMRLREKICSECHELASACSHSKSKKDVLAPA